MHLSNHQEEEEARGQFKAVLVRECCFTSELSLVTDLELSARALAPFLRKKAVLVIH